MTKDAIRQVLYPPFGTLRPMIIRLVADIQNGLFWRAATGGASE